MNQHSIAWDTEEIKLDKVLSFSKVMDLQTSSWSYLDTSSLILTSGKFSEVFIHEDLFYDHHYYYHYTVGIFVL